MLCDLCHKREAIIHITEVINDQARELHVCQKCAEAEGIKMQQNFGISDLLSGLVEFPSFIEEEKVLKCPNCGMTYSDFRKLGKLGCGSCYTAFREVLMPLLKNIHGSGHHAGREPKKEVEAKKLKPPKTEDRIAELKDKLQKAIQSEEYEQAAVLRDKIRALEKEK